MFAVSAALLTGCAPSKPPPWSGAPRLGVQQVVKQALAEGQTSTFAIPLNARDFLRVRVEQRNVDVTLTLLTPNGDPNVLFDGDNATDGPEWLAAWAETGGVHGLEIAAIDGAGSFELLVETVGPPKDADLQLLDALQALKLPDNLPPDLGQVTELEALLSMEDGLLPGLIRARVQYKLGNIRRKLGDLPKAIDDLSLAFKGLLRFGNAWEQAPALNSLALVQIRLGRFEEAEVTLHRAAEIGSSVNFPTVLAATWNNFGILHAARGEHSEALDAYERAESGYEQAGYAPGRAESLHNLGFQLLLLGRVEEGLGTLQLAVELRRQLNDSLGEAEALAASAWALELSAELGDQDRDFLAALGRYRRAAEVFEARGAKIDLAQALERQGEIYRRLDRVEEAKAALERSMGVIDSETSRMQAAWTHLGLGAVLRDMGRLDEAQRESDWAVQEFDALGLPSGQVASRLALARLERLAGRRERAAAILEKAIARVERSRGGLRTPEFRSTFLAVRQEVYSELVDLWAEASHAAARSTSPTAQAVASDLAKRAFQAAEQQRARALLDRLAEDRRGKATMGPLPDERRRVLDALEARWAVYGSASPDPGPTASNRARPDDDLLATTEALGRARLDWERAGESPAVVPPPQAEPLEVAAILPLLNDETSLLAFSLGQTRSWAFLLHRDEIQVFPLPPRRTIEAAATRAHELLPRWGTPGLQKAAQLAMPTLASLVIGPLKSSLPHGRLVIVPDGALHLVPFALLPDLKGEALLASRDIVQLPSASVLVYLRQRAMVRDTAEGFLALVADPIFSPDDPRLRANAAKVAQEESPHEQRYLPRLEGSGEEARRIAALAQEVRNNAPIVLYDSFEANRDLVTSGALADYRLLHFATHGIVDACDPTLAGLMFSVFNPDGRSRDGYLPARELYGLELRADLVVLSACRTAVGQRIRGEGLVGLSHSFFAAGARHLIVSLWEVDDRAGAELMTRFYRIFFAQGGDPAKALRLAQLEMRDETSWSAPKYWAGFIAIGDWEIRGFD